MKLATEIEITAQSLVTLLVNKQLQITTAESCTGGMIAAAITGIAGASKVFSQGYVVYSDLAKQKLLGVNAQILQQHGAVSEPTVLAMLQQACNLIPPGKWQVVGIAVSGIAGPDGGSDEKPVGTVHLACGSGSARIVEQQLFAGSRQEIRQRTTLRALQTAKLVAASIPKTRMEA